MPIPRSFVISCSLRSEQGSSLSFAIEEFVELDDGSRVLVRDDRGWGSKTSGGRDPWYHESAGSIRAQALDLWELYLDEEDGLDWVVPVLKTHGIAATAPDLEALPVSVELTEEIQDKTRVAGAREEN